MQQERTGAEVQRSLPMNILCEWSERKQRTAEGLSSKHERCPTVTGSARAATAILLTAVSLLIAGCTAPSPDFLSPLPGVVHPRASPLGPLTDTSGVGARQVLEAFRARSMTEHLEALQRLADENHGNRASGTSGYEDSARYVEEQLRAAGYSPVRQAFTYRREGELVKSFNILADTGGNADRTVLLGAHLDSVQKGPGINDNASGVAAVLETALWIAEAGIKPANRVRFAFWAAEEDNLNGSRHYVNELSAAELRRTAVYLNMDVVASPNGVRSIHDGDGSDFGTAGPEGSGEIEELFFRYFKENSLPAETTVFDGGSDYEPFLNAGVPGGGLFAGDVERKTAAQAQTYGGQAGRDLDACFHKACDTLENINPELLREMAGALAYATVWFGTAERP